MATLTEDLLREILLRLSVMDVMRLKSVCKSWNSLIKSSSFISRYNNRDNNNNDDDDDDDEDEPFIVIVNCDGTLILSSYNDLLEHHRSHQNPPQNPTTTYRNLKFRWVCCCDGGLMLGGVGYSVLEPTPKIMWNPATGETKVLLNYPREFDYNDLEVYGLLKEVRGIGFDSKDNEYKPFFARMVYLENMARMEIDIYSFKENQWRKLVVEQTEEIMFDSAGMFGWGAERVVYANGIAYWIVFNDASGRFMIVAFDMSNKEVTMIPFPDEIASTPAGNGNIIYSMGYCPYHLLFNESLALVSHLRGEDDNGNLINYSNCSYEIGVLVGYGDKASWSKVVTVPPLPLALQGICTRFVGFLNQTNIFVLRVDEEEDDTKVRCRGVRKGKLFLYDTLTRQALDLHISGIFTMVMTCPKTLFPILSQ